jgi:hypothetical protein
VTPPAPPPSPPQVTPQSTGGTTLPVAPPPSVDPNIPAPLQPLLQGGNVTVNPEAIAPGGKIPIPPGAPPAADLMKDVTLSTKDGRIIITKPTDLFDASVVISAKDGKLTVGPADPTSMIDRPGAALVEPAIRLANDDLAKRGLKIDELTVDANGQIHVKTSKLAAGR